ncbi:TonB-dependent hemoglobin/transferrin/lactoferrin family receptor [Candidimonas nitroreducens]|uniref:TonB-dependent receptor n=1 Tax=Candidimonas nitroreducens TaxID=683354 RepID=A0A225M603_9BURK|nr:TonB-dependent hemoglobin/transferrin/lactoferrin family receptor [Candidimonas nitroreducens]OWT56774.1 TonB-dependent receptor [Candidimonas nitroreducens]
MASSKSTVWCSGALLMVLATPGVAQVAAQAQGPQAGDAAAVPSLAPVTVQGQALQTALPDGATITTRAQLDDRSINSWDDLSQRGEPGVNFNRQNNSVNLRGLDGDRVATTLDGVALPWLTDGARGVQGGLNTIDFNTLTDIEVLRGPNAARSGALAGALALRSLMPADVLQPGRDFGALLKSGHDSADDSIGADAALAGRVGEGTSWLLQAGQRRGHELQNMADRGGYGAQREQPNPETYKQQNARLVLQHEWSSGHTLSLSGDTFRRQSTIDMRTEQGAAEDFQIGHDTTNEELARDRVMLDYGYRSPQGQAALDEAGVKLYWQRMRLDTANDGLHNTDARAYIIPGDPFRYGYPSGPYGRDNSIEESGFGLQARAAGHLAGAVAQHWSVGAQWYGNRTEQLSAGYDNCPAVPPGLPALFGPRTCGFLHSNQSDMPRVTGNQWALWAQDELSWADGRYGLTPALRFDAYRQKPESGGSYSSNPNSGVQSLSSSSGQRLSPSLLASFRPREDVTLYAKYGYGFKAPSATQLYLNYGGPGTYLSVGNPDLKPETSHGWELGVDAGDAKLGGRLSFYDNRYRNFIEGVPLTASSAEWQQAWNGLYPLGVTGYVNRAHVRIYGAELSGHWQFQPGWHVRGALAWADGRDQDTGQHLNSVAPLKIVAALGYGTEHWGAEGIVTAARPRHQVEYPQATADAPYADFQAPGYGLLDLTAWWKPTAVKGLRVQAGVYNVFDKKYWNALDVPTAGGSAIPLPVDTYTQPGRSLRVAVTYRY